MGLWGRAGGRSPIGGRNKIRNNIMIKNFLIIALAVLLAVSSYLMYENKNITIIVSISDTSRQDKPAQAGHENKSRYEELYEKEILGTLTSETSKDTDIRDDVESVDSAGEIKIHLDPAVRLTISPESQMVMDYRVIGPRKFSLLTDKDEPMVVIDLDTGTVTISPEYSLDEVSMEFWKSIGKKYPEVCFVE